MRALLVVALLLLLVPSCDEAVAAPEGAPKRIESLDDPQNPYKDMYSKWDERIYSELKAASDKGELWSIDASDDSRAPDFGQGFGCYIDKQGYLVPMFEQLRKRHELYRDSRESGLTFIRWYHISVHVPISDEDYEEYTAESNKVLADFYPPIPRWIYEKTPAAASLLPDGNIHCIGEPGVWQEHQKNMPPSTRWPNRSIQNEHMSSNYLYSNDGELLATSSDWMTPTLYSDKRYHELLESAGLSALTDQTRVTPDGYMVVERDGEVAAIFDYTGAVIPGDKLPRSRDRHNFMSLSSHQLRSLYEAQQALAAASAAP